MSFDDHIASRTIWGEARGESRAGRRAVAWVIANRVKRGTWGKTAAAVCLANMQFSCWNANDPNRRKMLELDEHDKDLDECLEAWWDVDSMSDPTDGACHYKVVGTSARWAEGVKPSCTIGAHDFYTGIA